jgi:hypothetical protein
MGEVRVARVNLAGGHQLEHRVMQRPGARRVGSLAAGGKEVGHELVGRRIIDAPLRDQQRRLAGVDECTHRLENLRRSRPSRAYRKLIALPTCLSLSPSTDLLNRFSAPSHDHSVASSIGGAASSPRRQR